jgi:hypothetical protein
MAMLALNQPFGGFVYRRRYYVYEIARGKFKTRRTSMAKFQEQYIADEKRQTERGLHDNHRRWGEVGGGTVVCYSVALAASWARKQR